MGLVNPIVPITATDLTSRLLDGLERVGWIKSNASVQGMKRIMVYLQCVVVFASVLLNHLRHSAIDFKEEYEEHGSCFKSAMSCWKEERRSDLRSRKK